MGDKSPKATQKKSGQKQAKASSANAKKNAAVAAKQSAGKKNNGWRLPVSPEAKFRRDRFYPSGRRVVVAATSILRLKSPHGKEPA